MINQVVDTYVSSVLLVIYEEVEWPKHLIKRNHRYMIHICWMSQGLKTNWKSFCVAWKVFVMELLGSVEDKREAPQEFFTKSL